MLVRYGSAVPRSVPLLATGAAGLGFRWLLRCLSLLSVALGALVLLGALLGVKADSRLRDLPRLAPRPAAPAPDVAEAERDGVVNAHVVDAGGHPLAGASVRLFLAREPHYFAAGEGVTAASGSATVTRVPRGAIWVLGEADGFARASSQLVVEGGTRDVELRLEPAHSLELRVTDEQHTPLASATVLVTGSDLLPFGALTDARGVATLTRLGSAPYSVKASAPGYESVTRSDVSKTVELVLRRLGSISVHVKQSDGSPAAFASVEIGGATLWPARRTTADAKGDSRISGLLAGSYDLRASKEGQVSRVLVGVTLERGEARELTLELEPGRFVTALVTDDESPNPRLVPNADVVLAEEGLSTFPLRGRTGTDGKVTLGPISNGPATLSARAPDFVGSSMVAVPDAGSEPVHLTLPRGGSLRGEVVDARGFPVDGASIEVIGSDAAGLPIAETPQLLRFRRSHFSWALSGPPPLVSAGELGVMPGPIPPIPGRNSGLAAAAIDSAATPLDGGEDLTPWTTDTSGRFVASPVTPGRVMALVRHPDFVEAVSAPVTLGPGAEASVKVTLLRGGSLEGRVKDVRDQPVEGAEVEVLAEHGTFERATVTASDGSFAFSALPTDVVVSVRRAENPTRVAKRVSLHIAEEKRETLEIVLPAPREALAITVQDDRDEPLELAEVNVLSLDPTSPLRSTAFTDARGLVELPDARGLPLRVSLQAPGFSRRIVQLDASSEAKLTFKLARGAQVQGRVTALRGRRSVSGALVTASFQGSRKTATTDADGQYRIADVPLGPVKLQVSHPDFADAELSASVEDPGRRDRAFELPSIDLEEGGGVEGEVLDERGDPAAGARVAVGHAPSYLPTGALPRGVAVTDAHGAFSLSGLSAGLVSLEAYLPDRGRGSTQVEVRGGRTRSGLRITLRALSAEPDAFAPGGVAVTLGERGASPGLEIVIVSVAPGSEAERAGLLPGDVVLGIDGEKPSSMHDARARLGGPLQSDVIVSVARASSVEKLPVLREAVRR